MLKEQDLLLHVIDVSGIEGRNPVQDFYEINKELKKYSEKLSQRKQIIVANKIDVMQDDAGLKELEKLAKEKDLELFKISAVTGEGIKELITRVCEVLKTLPKEELIDIEDKVVYTLEDKDQEWNIRKEKDEYIVEGKAIERLMGRVNIQDNESMYYFQKCIRNMGIEQRLKEIGVKEGDTVRFLDFYFEWYN